MVYVGEGGKVLLVRVDADVDQVGRVLLADVVVGAFASDLAGLAGVLALAGG